MKFSCSGHSQASLRLPVCDNLQSASGLAVVGANKTFLTAIITAWVRSPVKINKLLSRWAPAAAARAGAAGHGVQVKT